MRGNLCSDASLVNILRYLGSKYISLSLWQFFHQVFSVSSLFEKGGRMRRRSDPFQPPEKLLLKIFYFLYLNSFKIA
jgi:hypothetical protein